MTLNPKTTALLMLDYVEDICNSQPKCKGQMLPAMTPFMNPTMLRDDERTLFPTDYDAYASTYAWTGRAVPWVLQPLIRSVGLLAAGASVLEIGCGTGNYISALAEGRPDLPHFGFDLSEAMLTEARGRGSSVVFVQGDASREFPFPDKAFGGPFRLRGRLRRASRSA